LTLVCQVTSDGPLGTEAMLAQRGNGMCNRRHPLQSEHLQPAVGHPFLCATEVLATPHAGMATAPNATKTTTAFQANCPSRRPDGRRKDRTFDAASRRLMIPSPPAQPTGARETRTTDGATKQRRGGKKQRRARRPTTVCPSGNGGFRRSRHWVATRNPPTLRSHWVNDRPHVRKEPAPRGTFRSDESTLTES
jgi:hypothetical protein